MHISYKYYKKSHVIINVIFRGVLTTIVTVEKQ
jgi:hypothetical protein